MSSIPGKGKVATKGQKQIFDDNQSTIRFYFVMAVAGTMLHFLTNYFLFHQSTARSSWVLFVLSLITESASIYLMKYMARPIHAENGHLIDAGIDLNMEGGFGEYTKDLVIISTIVQILSILSFWFWLLYGLVPAYVSYFLWTRFISPWIFAPGPDDGNETDEKKRKKREKRMIFKAR